MEFGLLRAADWAEKEISEAACWLALHRALHDATAFGEKKGDAPHQNDGADGGDGQIPNRNGAETEIGLRGNV
jgi:hypothetical protein